jgi:hypothetical protein
MLTSALDWFETALLAWEENRTSLPRLDRELLAQEEGVGSRSRVVLDVDSGESPAYGEQEQSAYNGYFGSVCYYPLFLFNSQGDCLVAKLRPGNVHSAEGWEDLLPPEIERQQRNSREVVFRADAAFAKPEIHGALEARGVEYAIRLLANNSLERDINELLTRPVGRPSQRPVVRYKLRLSGCQLENGTASGGEGGVPLWRTVSSSGIRCDQPGVGQSGCGGVL